MTEEEFLKFWTNYTWTDVEPVHYRLYYDDLGLPLFYSHDDLPGKYIDVTPEQFVLQERSVRVINNKLVRQRTARMAKLVPAESGTLCHTRDVTVVVTDHPGQYWKKTENVVETN
jgi:F420-0:gamma-glutamyl ligase